MNKRTKACNISNKVRIMVKQRDDDSCIFCGSNYGVQLCHVVPRSKGGLGIPENLVTGCIHCHGKMDQSVERKNMLKIASDYLYSIYDDFDSVNKIFKKGVI